MCVSPWQMLTGNLSGASNYTQMNLSAFIGRRLSEHLLWRKPLQRRRRPPCQRKTAPAEVTRSGKRLLVDPDASRLTRERNSFHMCCRLSVEVLWRTNRFASKKKRSTLTMLCFLKSAVQVKQEVPERVFAFDCRLSLVCMPVSTRAEREKTRKQSIPLRLWRKSKSLIMPKCLRCAFTGCARRRVAERAC